MILMLIEEFIRHYELGLNYCSRAISFVVFEKVPFAVCKGGRDERIIIGNILSVKK